MKSWKFTFRKYRKPTDKIPYSMFVKYRQFESLQEAQEYAETHTDYERIITEVTEAEYLAKYELHC